MSLDIEISKDGYKILVENIDGKKKYLGNKYNQKREIEKFIDKFNNNLEKDNYIVFGLFFAEHIQELLKAISLKSRILIVEYNLEIVDICKNDDELKKILDNPQVNLALADSDIEGFFKQYINENNVANLKIEEYCSYYSIYKEYLYDKYTLIKQEITRITLNRNTILEVCDIFFDNFLGNLKYLAKATPVNVLKDKYKGIPAIIVSAGPSLGNNIDYLKKSPPGLILSGGRTLRTLIEKDIIPDCVGSVDFSEYAFRLVNGYLNKFDIPLVVSDKTNAKILEEHSGDKFFFSDSEFLNEIWKKDIMQLFGGGSIAHALTLLALYMGCNPVVFIGQDLAYTDEREHYVLAENTWERPTDEKLFKDISDVYVQDINGKLVRTSVQLNDYRFSLEKIIKDNPNTTFINATEGGANIKGAINMLFKDVVKEFQEVDIESMSSYSDNSDKTKEIIRKLQESNKNIKKYINLCKEGIEISRAWKIDYNMKNYSNLRRYEEKLRKLDDIFTSDLKYIKIVNPILTQIACDIQNNKNFIINSSDNLEVKLRKNIYRLYEVYSQIMEVFQVSYTKIEMVIESLK